MLNYKYFPKNIPIFPFAHLPNVSFLDFFLTLCFEATFPIEFYRGNQTCFVFFFFFSKT